MKTTWKFEHTISHMNHLYIYIYIYHIWITYILISSNDLCICRLIKYSKIFMVWRMKRYPWLDIQLILRHVFPEHLVCENRKLNQTWNQHRHEYMCNAQKRPSVDTEVSRSVLVVSIFDNTWKDSPNLNFSEQYKWIKISELK